MNTTKSTSSLNILDPINKFSVTVQDDMLVFKMEDGRVNKMMLFPFQLQILKELYKEKDFVR